MYITHKPEAAQWVIFQFLDTPQFLHIYSIDLFLVEIDICSKLLSDITYSELFFWQTCCLHGLIAVYWIAAASFTLLDR